MDEFRDKVITDYYEWLRLNKGMLKRDIQVRINKFLEHERNGKKVNNNNA